MAETRSELVERGLAVAGSPIYRQNKIWARNTDEKASVAASLTTAIRALFKAVPLEQPLAALSIGSGDEPQFRILLAAFQAGVSLYDIDEHALETVRKRLDRQMIGGVATIRGDYTRDFVDPTAAKQALASRLGSRPFDLITLHHVLYYSAAEIWPTVVKTLFSDLLASPGAMHLALMSARENRPGTTTWLYNHFAYKFFGRTTDQDLLRLGELVAEQVPEARVVAETREVRFRVDDFERFMAVIWMIMLYPDGHDYDLGQRTEITEFVIDHFWLPRRPLLQSQDYVSIFKGL